jgi:effector-binding domain-containing protein
MSQKDLLEEKFYSSEAFVFIDMNYSLEKHIKVLSPNYYLCIYCYEYSDEIKYIGRLMEEIKEKGYQICGDYLCESMADIPAVDNKSRGMNLRLQIPITFK